MLSEEKYGISEENKYKNQRKKYDFCERIWNKSVFHLTSKCEFHIYVQKI